jgi:hypothetical protein
MQELNNLMQYAVSLEFNPPQSPDGVAAVGIVFANSKYCREAYFHLKSQLKGEKINLGLTVKAVTLALVVEDLSGEQIFTAELNYDLGYLTEFTKLWPPGQPVTMIFGSKSNCNIYIINPEADQKVFQPFFANNYEVIK